MLWRCLTASVAIREKNARADVYPEWHGLEEEELAFVIEGKVLLEARVDGDVVEGV